MLERAETRKALAMAVSDIMPLIVGALADQNQLPALDGTERFPEKHRFKIVGPGDAERATLCCDARDTRRDSGIRPHPLRQRVLRDVTP